MRALRQPSAQDWKPLPSLNVYLSVNLQTEGRFCKLLFTRKSPKLAHIFPGLCLLVGGFRFLPNPPLGFSPVKISGINSTHSKPHSNTVTLLDYTVYIQCYLQRFVATNCAPNIRYLQLQTSVKFNVHKTSRTLSLYLSYPGFCVLVSRNILSFSSYIIRLYLRC